MFAAAVAVGMSAQQLTLALVLAAIAYLAWHLLHLARLTNRLMQGRRLRPPFPPGLWHEIFSRVDALQRGHRKRKQCVMLS